ncbi:uncharacterized protein LOC141555027 [Sminthopsis crassicaudata]|uniref:uncharacterized protein LOC141555027 n=1 Tax=Sminthopsis crassicaudata TaxID=9301 RepID=UPI003D690DFE
MGQMLAKFNPWTSADSTPAPDATSAPFRSGTIESIIKIIEEQSLLVTWVQIAKLLAALRRTSPWFLEEEKIDVDKWKLVGYEMKEFQAKNGPRSISAEVFYIYNIVQLALNYQASCRRRKSSKNEQRRKCEEKRKDQDLSLEQEDLNEELWYDSLEEASTLPREQIIDRPTSTPPSEMEEERGEEAETQTELPVKKPKPMTRLEKALVKAKREGQDISDFIHAYPVIENTDSVGKKRRRYAPLDLNTIKDLKKGCTLYGATSAYVKMLLDGLSYEVLTPNDWKSIARTCLEPGENLLWLAEFHELCKIQVRCNLEIGVNTQFTFEHLAGEGQYGENSEQINYTMTIYEQIAKAAIKAWGVLPGQKDRGEAFTKIQQGPNEPFADFVGRLQTAVKRTIGENSATEIMTRHLAKENANEICKRIIWGLDKDAPLEEIIRRCATVGTNAFYTQTMMNVERQGPSWQGTSRETRRCFQCGKIGHLRAQCRYGDTVRRQGERRPKTPCPKCNRGLHWASECRIIQRNGMRGPGPGPQAKKTWGMMAADVTPKEPLEGQDSDLINQQRSNHMAERDYLISQSKGNQIAKMDYTWGEYRPFKPTGLCPVQTIPM